MSRPLPILTLLLLAACGGGSGDETASEAASTPAEAKPQALRVDPAQSGGLQGVVRVLGEVGPPAILSLSADAWCKNHHDTPPADESLLVHDGKLE
ncbi:MAG TPA: hypothetical protein VLA56_07625, partial [Pseudomonadales bacterium]|nr:hypothetical protein [Pseudomonadales bacterium]